MEESQLDQVIGDLMKMVRIIMQETKVKVALAQLQGTLPKNAPKRELSKK